MSTTNYTICVVFNDGGEVDFVFDTGSYHQDEVRVLNSIIENAVNGFVFFKGKSNKTILVNLNFVAIMRVKDKDDD